MKDAPAASVGPPAACSTSANGRQKYAARQLNDLPEKYSPGLDRPEMFPMWLCP